MNCIKYFKIIGDVIEPIVEHIVVSQGISRKEACSNIQKYLQIIRSEYYKKSQPNIPYSDPLCRIAYLYWTVPINASLVEFVFQRDPDLEEYLDEIQSKNNKITLCAFGGGPGTELLGLAKRIEKRKWEGSLNQQLWLNYRILDKINEWQDSWTAISHQIESTLEKPFGSNRNNWPFILQGNHSMIDITNLENFGKWGNLFGQDIHILSYIVSEVFDDAEDLQKFIIKMAEYAPEGSKFVFIERAEDRWKNKIKETADLAGLSLSGFIRKQNGRIDSEEEKTDLGRIYSELQWDPRLTYEAFWVVGTKE